MADTHVSLDALENRLEYCFTNKKLLETALTSPSYRATHPTEQDNQRLEFLGDAVLGLLVAEYVYTTYTSEPEGALTVRRTRVANGRALADVARHLGIGRHLRIGVSDVTTGGRDKERLLTDAMEAVIGAAWCDGGLVAAQAIFAVILREKSTEIEDLWAENPKGKLQELAQRLGWANSPHYALLATTGPDHSPSYQVEASVAQGQRAIGEGRTKRMAEANAAQKLLAVLHAENIH